MKDDIVVNLRQATEKDSETVLSWRNEPGTIPWMKTKRALTFNEHSDWYMKAITDPGCLFLIIEVNDTPVGQLRYDLERDMAKVSINITHDWHGKGVASAAFIAGSRYVKEKKFADKIFARVLAANTGSIRAMERAGYIIVGDIPDSPEPYLLMTHDLLEMN
jgi:RimJ/RimL family protein N-acetyltransferase